MIKSVLFIGLCLGVIPYLLGMLYTRFVTEEKNHIFLSLSAGYMIAFGWFQLICIPLLFAKASFHTLFILYGGTLLLASALSLFLNRKRILLSIKESLIKIRSFPLSIWLAILYLAGLLVVYIKYAYTNADDAFFVASANTSLATNTIFAVNPYTGVEYASLPSRYVLSPFHAFIATVAKAVDLHPAIVAHSVFMIVFFLLVYVVYTLIARVLFQKDLEKTGFFLILLTALHMFSGYSQRSAGLFLSIRIWQGKAILAGILLPFILYLALRLFYLKGTCADWVVLAFTMSACCMVSSMGIMLGAISIGLFGLIYALKQRSIRVLLYTGLACLPNIICTAVYLWIR